MLQYDQYVVLYINDVKLVSESASEDGNDEVETNKGKKHKCNHCGKLFCNRQSKSLHIKVNNNTIINNKKKLMFFLELKQKSFYQFK